MARKKKTRKGRKNTSFFTEIKNFAGNLVKALPFLIISATVVFLFLGIREVLYADPSLGIGRLVVNPADAISDLKKKAIEKDWLGKNIFKVDLKSIARDLERDPEIATAEIIRSIPSTLKIEITRRRPFAVIRFSPKGKYGVIADDGMILDISDQVNSSLILIEAYGSDRYNPKIGRKMAVEGYLEAVQFLRAFDEHPLAKTEKITQVFLDHLGNVSVMLGGGPEIRLGRHPMQKIASLNKIIPLLEGTGRPTIAYIELQFNDIVIKRKK